MSSSSAALPPSSGDSNRKTPSPPPPPSAGAQLTTKRRMSTLTDESGAKSAIRGDTALTILHVINAPSSSSAADDDDGENNNQKNKDDASSSSGLGEADIAIDEFRSACYTTWERIATRKRQERNSNENDSGRGGGAMAAMGEVVEAFSVNNEIQSKSCLGAADMRKLCVLGRASVTASEAANEKIGGKTNHKKKDQLQQQPTKFDAANFNDEQQDLPIFSDPFDSDFTAALDERAIGVVAMNVANAHVSIDDNIDFKKETAAKKKEEKKQEATGSGDKTSPNKQLGNLQQLKNAKENDSDDDDDDADDIDDRLLVISENSFAETAEDLVYVRIWKSRREGRKFQSALKQLAATRQQLLLPSTVFGVPHSTALAFQGKFVTVTWLVPLMDEWPAKTLVEHRIVEDAQMRRRASSIGGGIVGLGMGGGGDNNNNTNNGERVGSASKRGAPMKHNVSSLVGQVAACWSLALGMPANVPSPSSSSSSTTIDSYQPLPLYIASDGRYYAIACGELFKDYGNSTTKVASPKSGEKDAKTAASALSSSAATTSSTPLPKVFNSLLCPQVGSVSNSSGGAHQPLFSPLPTPCDPSIFGGDRKALFGTKTTHLRLEHKLNDALVANEVSSSHNSSSSSPLSASAAAAAEAHLYTGLYDRAMRTFSAWLQVSTDGTAANAAPHRHINLPETDLDLFSKVLKAAGVNMQYLYLLRAFVDERFQSEGYAFDNLFATSSNPERGNFQLLPPKTSVVTAFRNGEDQGLSLNKAALHDSSKATIRCDANNKMKFLALIDEEMACRSVLSIVEAAMMAAAAGPRNTVLTSVDFGVSKGNDSDEDDEKQKDDDEDDDEGGGNLDKILRAANKVLRELQENPMYFKKDVMTVLRCKFNAPKDFQLSIKDVNLKTISYFVSDRLGLSYNDKRAMFVGFEKYPLPLSHTGRMEISDASFQQSLPQFVGPFTDFKALANLWRERLVVAQSAIPASLTATSATKSPTPTMMGITSKPSSASGSRSFSPPPPPPPAVSEAGILAMDAAHAYANVCAITALYYAQLANYTATRPLNGVGTAITATANQHAPTTAAAALVVVLPLRISRFIAEIASLRFGAILGGSSAVDGKPVFQSGIFSSNRFSFLGTSGGGGGAGANGAGASSTTFAPPTNKLSGLWYAPSLMIFTESFNALADPLAMLDEAANDDDKDDEGDKKKEDGDDDAEESEEEEEAVAFTGDMDLSNVKLSTIEPKKDAGGKSAMVTSSSDAAGGASVVFKTSELCFLLPRRELSLLSSLPFLASTDVSFVCDRAFFLYLHARAQDEIPVGGDEDEDNNGGGEVKANAQLADKVQAKTTLSIAETARLLKIWAGAITLGHEVFAKEEANDDDGNNNTNDDTVADPMWHARAVGRSFAFFATLPNTISNILMQNRFISIRREVIAALAICASGDACSLEFDPSDPNDVEEIGVIAHHDDDDDDDESGFATSGKKNRSKALMAMSSLCYSPTLGGGAGSPSSPRGAALTSPHRRGYGERGGHSTNNGSLNDVSAAFSAGGVDEDIVDRVQSIKRGIVQTACLAILAYFDDLLAEDEEDSDDDDEDGDENSNADDEDEDDDEPPNKAVIASLHVARHLCAIVGLLDANGYGIAMALSVTIASHMMLGSKKGRKKRAQHQQQKGEKSAEGSSIADETMMMSLDTDAFASHFGKFSKELRECRYAFARLSDAQSYNDSLMEAGERYLPCLRSLSRLIRQKAKEVKNAKESDQSSLELFPRGSKGKLLFSTHAPTDETGADSHRLLNLANALDFFVAETELLLKRDAEEAELLALKNKEAQEKDAADGGGGSVGGGAETAEGLSLLASSPSFAPFANTVAGKEGGGGGGEADGVENDRRTSCPFADYHGDDETSPFGAPSSHHGSVRSGASKSHHRHPRAPLALFANNNLSKLSATSSVSSKALSLSPSIAAVLHNNDTNDNNSKISSGDGGEKGSGKSQDGPDAGKRTNFSLPSISGLSSPSLSSTPQKTHSNDDQSRKQPTTITAAQNEGISPSLTSAKVDDADNETAPAAQDLASGALVGNATNYLLLAGLSAAGGNDHDNSNSPTTTDGGHIPDALKNDNKRQDKIGPNNNNAAGVGGNNTNFESFADRAAIVTERSKRANLQNERSNATSTALANNPALGASLGGGGSGRYSPRSTTPTAAAAASSTRQLAAGGSGGVGVPPPLRRDTYSPTAAIATSFGGGGAVDPSLRGPSVASAEGGAVVCPKTDKTGSLFDVVSEDGSRRGDGDISPINNQTDGGSDSDAARSPNMAPRVGAGAAGSSRSAFVAVVPPSSAMPINPLGLPPRPQSGSLKLRGLRSPATSALAVPPHNSNTNNKSRDAIVHGLNPANFDGRITPRAGNINDNANMTTADLDANSPSNWGQAGQSPTASPLVSRPGSGNMGGGGGSVGRSGGIAALKRRHQQQQHLLTNRSTNTTPMATLPPFGGSAGETLPPLARGQSIEGSVLRKYAARDAGTSPYSSFANYDPALHGQFARATSPSNSFRQKSLQLQQRQGSAGTTATATATSPIPPFAPLSSSRAETPEAKSARLAQHRADRDEAERRLRAEEMKRLEAARKAIEESAAMLKRQGEADAIMRLKEREEMEKAKRAVERLAEEARRHAVEAREALAEARRLRGEVGGSGGGGGADERGRASSAGDANASNNHGNNHSNRNNANVVTATGAATAASHLGGDNGNTIGSAPSSAKAGRSINHPQQAVYNRNRLGAQQQQQRQLQQQQELRQRSEQQQDTADAQQQQQYQHQQHHYLEGRPIRDESSSTSIAPTPMQLSATPPPNTATPPPFRIRSAGSPPAAESNSTLVTPLPLPARSNSTAAAEAAPAPPLPTASSSSKTLADAEARTLFVVEDPTKVDAAWSAANAEAKALLLKQSEEKARRQSQLAAKDAQSSEVLAKMRSEGLRMPEELLLPLPSERERQRRAAEDVEAAKKARALEAKAREEAAQREREAYHVQMARYREEEAERLKPFAVSQSALREGVTARDEDRRVVEVDDEEMEGCGGGGSGGGHTNGSLHDAVAAGGDGPAEKGVRRGGDADSTNTSATATNNNNYSTADATSAHSSSPFGSPSKLSATPPPVSSVVSAGGVSGGGALNTNKNSFSRHSLGGGREGPLAGTAVSAAASGGTRQLHSSINTMTKSSEDDGADPFADHHAEHATHLYPISHGSNTIGGGGTDPYHDGTADDGNPTRNSRSSNLSSHSGHTQNPNAAAAAKTNSRTSVTFLPSPKKASPNTTTTNSPHRPPQQQQQEHISTSASSSSSPPSASAVKKKSDESARDEKDQHLANNNGDVDDVNDDDPNSTDPDVIFKRKRAAYLKAIEDQHGKAAEWRAKLQALEDERGAKLAAARAECEEAMRREHEASQLDKAKRQWTVEEEAQLREPILQSEMEQRQRICESFVVEIPNVHAKTERRIEIEVANAKRRREEEEAHARRLRALNTELEREEALLAARMAIVRQKLEIDERKQVALAESEARRDGVESDYVKALEDIVERERYAMARLLHQRERRRQQQQFGLGGGFFAGSDSGGNRSSVDVFGGGLDGMMMLRHRSGSTRGSVSISASGGGAGGADNSDNATMSGLIEGPAAASPPPPPTAIPVSDSYSRMIITLKSRGHNNNLRGTAAGTTSSSSRTMSDDETPSSTTLNADYYNDGRRSTLLFVIRSLEAEEEPSQRHIIQQEEKYRRVGLVEGFRMEERLIREDEEAEREAAYHHELKRNATGEQSPLKPLPPHHRLQKDNGGQEADCESIMFAADHHHCVAACGVNELDLPKDQQQHLPRLITSPTPPPNLQQHHPSPPLAVADMLAAGGGSRTTTEAAAQSLGIHVNSGKERPPAEVGAREVPRAKCDAAPISTSDRFTRPHLRHQEQTIGRPAMTMLMTAPCCAVCNAPNTTTKCNNDAPAAVAPAKREEGRHSSCNTLAFCVVSGQPSPRPPSSSLVDATAVTYADGIDSNAARSLLRKIRETRRRTIDDDHQMPQQRRTI